MAFLPDPVVTERGAEVSVSQQDDPIILALRDVTIGDYEILAELGRGGMAVVYLAHDLALDRKVAIKVLFPPLLTGAGAAERFKHEARTAASLNHPGIPIYAVKQRESLLYFVMRFVGGRGLWKGRLPASATLLSGQRSRSARRNAPSSPSWPKRGLPPAARRICSARETLPSGGSGFCRPSSEPSRPVRTWGISIRRESHQRRRVGNRGV